MSDHQVTTAQRKDKVLEHYLQIPDENESIMLRIEELELIDYLAW